MDLARSYDGAQGFPHWILAASQTQARGRQGRSWLSPAGAFAASLVMQPFLPPRSSSAALFSLRPAPCGGPCRALWSRRPWLKNGQMMFC
jgi:biotin-(acetyl-CoA carboxylase) ligase